MTTTPEGACMANYIAAIVMKTGKAEIVNDVPSDPRHIKGTVQLIL